MQNVFIEKFICLNCKIYVQLVLLLTEIDVGADVMAKICPTCKNVFAQILKYICLTCKIDLSKLQNAFV